MTFYEVWGSGDKYVTLRCLHPSRPSDHFEMITIEEAPKLVPHYEVTDYSVGCVFGHRPNLGVWSVELANLLIDNGMTGILTHPVQVSHNSQSVSGFVGVRIVGRGGAFDRARSGVVLWSDLSNKPISHKSVYMDDSGWDGCDVFLIPELGGRLFVTERAALAIRALSDLKELILTSNDKASLP